MACASGPGRKWGIHPSASRAARRRTGSLSPPIQIGIVGRGGKGLRPASLTRCHCPSMVTRSRAQRARSTAICSSMRAPRFVKRSPRASNSTAFQPTPTPRRSRPAESTSTAAACFATSAVCRWGRIRIPVTSSTRRVAAARKPNSTNGSWKEWR